MPKKTVSKTRFRIGVHKCRKKTVSKMRLKNQGVHMQKNISLKHPPY